MRTPRIDAWLRRDFPEDSHAAAAQLVSRISIDLITWSIVSESDRVEAAALQYAQADLSKLEAAVDLALLDWRDLLVRVGAA